MSQRRTVPRNSPEHSPEGGGSGLVGLFSLWRCSSLWDAQCRQWLACISATITMFWVGTVYGWSNSSFLLLTSEIGDAPLTLTGDEYSWSVSLTVLSSMIGSLLVAQLADRIGRKYCLVACSIIFTVGWLYMYSADSVPILYFARGMLGIGVGIARTINPMFVSEVADIKLRGRLGTLIAANVYAGSLLTYALGPSVTYTSHLLLLAGISATSILPLMPLRETPYFLAAEGNKEQASKSIAYYKGIEDPDQVKVELRALRAEARYGLHQQSRSDLHSQSSSDLPSTYSSSSPSQTSSDLPPPYSSILPLPSSSDLPPSYSSILHSPSSSNLPPPYSSNLPTQSIRETHSDTTREEVGTEATSDLDLPSSSDSHSQSIPSVHSKFKCKVRTQTTGELRVEYSRVSPGLHSQSRSDLHQPSTSQMHRSSTSQMHRSSTSQMHRSSTSEVRRSSTSEIHRPSTSQVLPQTRSELHSRARSHLQTQSSQDSQESTDIPETYTDLTKYTCLNKLRALQQRSNRKALFIMLGLIMAQQFSGNFITTQNLEVLTNTKTTFMDLYTAMILVQLVRILSGYLTTLIVEWYGRRTLLILSTLGSCSTLAVLAIYFLLDQLEFDVSNISFVPIIDLILYQVLFHIGIGTLPNILICELFPTKLKGIVGAIVVIFDGIIGFTASKLNQVMTDNYGRDAIFFFSATSCILAFMLVFIWVPESKGKTYNEIETLLVGENLNSLNEEVRTDEMEMHRL